VKQEWKQCQLWLCVANSNKETSKKEKNHPRKKAVNKPTATKAAASIGKIKIGQMENHIRTESDRSSCGGKATAQRAVQPAIAK